MKQELVRYIYKNLDDILNGSEGSLGIVYQTYEGKDEYRSFSKDEKSFREYIEDMIKNKYSLENTVQIHIGEFVFYLYEEKDLLVELFPVNDENMNKITKAFESFRLEKEKPVLSFAARGETLYIRFSLT